MATPGAVAGAHTAVARLDASGTLALTLDGEPVGKATGRGPIAAMPVDGLNVGSDEGGAVGSYKAPNKFAGLVESVAIELQAK